MSSSSAPPSTPSEERSRRHLTRRAQPAAMAAAFVVPTLVVRAFGTGWGTAATVGQIAFLAATLLVILRGT